MTPEEIEFVLREHKKYLNRKGGARADLRGADLRNAELRNAELRGANLSCADLRNAELRNAELRGTNLSCANLSGSELRGANLSGANLCNAELRNAELRNADLLGADLSGANLSGANLSNAKGHGIIRIDISPWSVCIYPDNRCTIGCETYSHEFWLNATASDVKNMNMRAAEWWMKNGAMVKAAIRSMEAKA